jgi:hypothetical protein
MDLNTKDLVAKLETIATRVNPMRAEWNIRYERAKKLLGELWSMWGNGIVSPGWAANAASGTRAEDGRPDWWVDARLEAHAALDEWLESVGIGKGEDL